MDHAGGARSAPLRDRDSIVRRSRSSVVIEVGVVMFAMFLITVGSLEHRRRAARINKPWWSGERDPTAVAVCLETVSPGSRVA
jgi:hypothetical protein